MNKDSYNALPEDLQQIIDDHSGLALAAPIGEAWDSIEPVGIQRAVDAGNSVTQLSPEASAAFEAPFAATVARWVAEAQDAEIEATTLLDAAQAAIAANTAE